MMEEARNQPGDMMYSSSNRPLLYVHRLLYTTIFLVNAFVAFPSLHPSPKIVRQRTDHSSGFSSASAALRAFVLILSNCSSISRTFRLSVASSSFMRALSAASCASPAPPEDADAGVAGWANES